MVGDKKLGAPLFMINIKKVEPQKMEDLVSIKAHVDAHGFGCAIIGDQVAIGVIWTAKTVGAERRIEVTERVSTLSEACRVIGCPCPEDNVQNDMTHHHKNLASKN